MTRARGRMAALSAALLLGSGASAARDAGRVHVLSVGRGTALAASEGLDASNSYRSRVRFPQAPELSIRVRLPGGIGQAPASDANGNLFIVHSEPRLSKLDAKGRTLWSERLPSEASSAPILLSDGTLLVVTREAEALQFSTSGQRLAQRSLPFSDPRHRTVAVATASGGALLASDDELVELDSQARVVRQARLRGNVSTLLDSGAELIAVSEAGVVERGHTTGDFELVGSFAGNVTDGAAVQAGKVFAIVDGHKFLALDLSSGETSTIASTQRPLGAVRCCSSERAARPSSPMAASSRNAMRAAASSCASQSLELVPATIGAQWRGSEAAICSATRAARSPPFDPEATRSS